MTRQQNRTNLRVWLHCVVLVIACHVGSVAQAVPPDTRTETIFVASNGWHSAIFISRSALAPDSIPEIADFPKARYMGFGWGDAEYFPARDPDFMTLLSAALVPTSSVLHVTGLSAHPREAYPKDEVVALKISHGGLEKLMGYLADSFNREGLHQARPVAPGLDPNSRFYRATGEFHLFNTCNSWTARGLAVAGLPIDPDVVRAEDLIAQVRALASAGDSFK